MKRALIVTALLVTLTACGGGTEPESDPIPTIETSDTATSDTTPPTTSTTTTTTTPPAPVTEVPNVAPPPVQPAPYTPPPVQPAPYTPPPVQAPPPAPAPADAYYANCGEARAAGAAPLHRGDPGYRPALDRDDDGVACEN